MFNESFFQQLSCYLQRHNITSWLSRYSCKIRYSTDNRLFPVRFLYDAKWQNPFHSAKKITRVLEGKHKPIYHPMNDTGDHVVVINSRHVALLGREWQFRVYFHHPGIPRIPKNLYIQLKQYDWISDTSQL